MKTYESPKIHRASQWLGGAIIGFGVIVGGSALATYGLAELEANQSDAGHQDLAYELRQEGRWLLPREAAICGLAVLIAAANAAKVSADYDRYEAPGPADIPMALMAPDRPGLNHETTLNSYSPEDS